MPDTAHGPDRFQKFLHDAVLVAWWRQGKKRAGSAKTLCNTASRSLYKVRKIKLDYVRSGTDTLPFTRNLQSPEQHYGATCQSWIDTGMLTFLLLTTG